jgi:hypothetical protein
MTYPYVMHPLVVGKLVFAGSSLILPFIHFYEVVFDQFRNVSLNLAKLDTKTIGQFALRGPGAPLLLVVELAESGIAKFGSLANFGTLQEPVGNPRAREEFARVDVTHRHALCTGTTET